MTERRPVDRLTLAQARRVALRAQGLDRPRPERPVTAQAFGRLVERVGLVQIDSVNVVARAHLVPAFSRLGPYDTALVDRVSGRAPRRLVEAWAHEASYVPTATWPLLGWRRRAYLEHAWSTIASTPRAHPAELADVRAFVAERGPVTAREVHDALDHERPDRVDWGWNWTVAKRVLEFLFFTGEVSVARRTSTFERAYDLTGRVVPADVLARPEPDEADAVRALVEIGARAHGVGTVTCFADYFRVGPRRAAPAVADLVDDGVLLPVEVPGWPRQVYLHRDAAVPRRATGRALLSPFDPLVFERRRLEELFGMRYRIEIYTPEAKRVHGYYVLPFLLGDRMAARVDLKADRAAGVLRVLAAWGEPDAPASTAHELRAELALLAGWLGLERVALGDVARGDLVPGLAEVLGPGAAASVADAR